MNLVIDEAIEVTLAQKETPESRRKLGTFTRAQSIRPTDARAGQILLKGDNISLIQQIQQ
jgi:small nuclear ribonucleoprotein E